MNRFWRANRAVMAASAAAMSLALAAPASAQETFKLGIVTFLSGPAADSFGVPARNGAQFVIDQLNKGAAPSPYDKVGFGGMKIEPVIIDENGGATKQVQELRNLYQRDNVDVVVGYIGSGDCLAVAPIAEELKKLLVLFDCGTPRIFEESKYNYVFRTAAHATMDNVGLIRYMKAKNIKMDDAFGDQPGLRLGPGQPGRLRRRSQQLYPDAKLQTDLLPKFGAGQYGTEISALVGAGSDVVYSSLWGGDLQAFILQAAPRGLPKRSQLVFSAADHVLPPLGDKMPDGTIIGARGAYGLMSQKSPLNDWCSRAMRPPTRLSGAGRLSHDAVDPRPEGRGRKGDGQERRQEALDRRAGRGDDRTGMAIARRAHSDEACRRPSGDPADRLQPHQI